jgi:hypothetical protein
MTPVGERNPMHAPTPHARLHDAGWGQSAAFACMAVPAAVEPP